ncbi:MAG: fructosamine kinase family protein [Phycisphaerales bacterium]
MDIREQVGAAIGSTPDDLTPMSGGCVGEVYAAAIDGRRVVVKVDRRDQPNLDIEGRMLRLLADRSDLPVPEVLHAEPHLLVMAFIPAGGRGRGIDAQRNAADLLAALHDVVPETAAFGLEFDTLIGGLHQPNPWTDSWVAFFRQHRLLDMAGRATDAGRLPESIRDRIRTFAASHLADLIDEPASPSLIHGDVWGGNVIVGDGRINGFIDPAVYYAHAEIELAFITLFSTFGDEFFDRYRERRPIAPGFFETRRDIYNLYPLLVHVRLFGGGYVSDVDRILRRFGV